MEKYYKILRENLDDYRYNHSLCVAKKANELAKKYGADADKAYLAGLLHDITKNLSASEHLNIINKFGIILNDVEKNAEKLYHAISGALYVKYELLIDDDEIYDAIRYHTTAKADMPLLSDVIFIADFVSDDRNYPDIDIMRKLADEDLVKAKEYALSYTIKDLLKKGVAIHTDTLAAYNQVKLFGR